MRRVRSQTVPWIAPVLATIVLPGLVWVTAERPMPARLPLAGVMVLIVGFGSAVLFTVLFYGLRQNLRRALP